MTHTTDSLALLDAIRAHPGEDTPRLMLADAIEEFDPARAELIRLQCRPKCYPCECVQGIVKMQYDCPTCIAASRESALLTANESRWPHEVGNGFRAIREPVRITWDRGFIVRVTVPRLADLVEERGDSAIGWRLVPTTFARAVLDPANGSERALISELVPLDMEPWEDVTHSWNWSGTQNLPDLILQRAAGPHPAREEAISALGRTLAEFCRSR